MINLHLKRGDLVLSKEYGTGTVIKFLGKQYDYPIEVKFTDSIECFTIGGQYYLPCDEKKYSSSFDKNIIKIER